MLFDAVSIVKRGFCLAIVMSPLLVIAPEEMVPAVILRLESITSRLEVPTLIAVSYTHLTLPTKRIV